MKTKMHFSPSCISVDDYGEMQSEQQMDDLNCWGIDEPIKVSDEPEEDVPLDWIAKIYEDYGLEPGCYVQAVEVLCNECGEVCCVCGVDEDYCEDDCITKEEMIAALEFNYWENRKNREGYCHRLMDYIDELNKMPLAEVINEYENMIEGQIQVYED